MDSCWSHKKDYDDLRSNCSLDKEYGDDRANIDDFYYGRLNISGPKGSSGALLIRTLAFGLSGGNLIMIMSMAIFTLDIVVSYDYCCYDQNHYDDVSCSHGDFDGQEFSLSESDLYNMI